MNIRAAHFLLVLELARSLPYEVMLIDVTIGNIP